jgi:Rrf2 family protein
MLSKRAKYGLMAMVALARRGDSAPMRISDLAEQERLPRKFLEIILLELRNNGLLQSKKGSGGGYSLAKPPDLITLGQIVRILDGPLAPIPCVSQTAYEPCGECHDERTCAVRLVMKEVRDGIAAILDRTSLSDALTRSTAAVALMNDAVPGARRRKTARL